MWKLTKITTTTKRFLFLVCDASLLPGYGMWYWYIQILVVARQGWCVRRVPVPLWIRRSSPWSSSRFWASPERWWRRAWRSREVQTSRRRGPACTAPGRCATCSNPENKSNQMDKNNTRTRTTTRTQHRKRKTRKNTSDRCVKAKQARIVRRDKEKWRGGGGFLSIIQQEETTLNRWAKKPRQ